jgi:branched-chain amino acid transport system permease protein
MAIGVIGALGLNILTGFAGQISLGHGAFIGIGAYACAYFTGDLGMSFWVAMPLAGLVTAVIGMIFGIPSLRLKGLYLAIATLAAQFIIEYVIVHWEKVTNGVLGKLVEAPHIGSFAFDTDKSYFYLTITVAIILTIFAKNIIRTKTGRAFVSVRDNYIAAEIIGVDIFKYKLLAFAISSFYAGIAGSLWAHYLTLITPEHFTIGVSIEYLAMIIIGGLGSLIGSIFGAVFMIALPEFLRYVSSILGQTYPQITDAFAAIREGVFGLVIIFFLIYEPKGMAHRWNLIKAYWKLWPFSY